MVDAFVMAAKDDDVFESREPVGLVLVVTPAVGRGVDDFIVAAFALQFLHQLEHRFALHDHARLAAERVVVGGLALVVGIIVEVVDNDFDQPLLLCTLENRLMERRGQQFGNYGKNVDAHEKRIKN